MRSKKELILTLVIEKAAPKCLTPSSTNRPPRYRGIEVDLHVLRLIHWNQFFIRASIVQMKNIGKGRQNECLKLSLREEEQRNGKIQYM